MISKNAKAIPGVWQKGINIFDKNITIKDIKNLVVDVCGGKLLTPSMTDYPPEVSILGLSLPLFEETNGILKFVNPFIWGDFYIPGNTSLHENATYTHNIEGKKLFKTVGVIPAEKHISTYDCYGVEGEPKALFPFLDSLDEDDEDIFLVKVFTYSLDKDPKYREYFKKYDKVVLSVRNHENTRFRIPLADYLDKEFWDIFKISLDSYSPIVTILIEDIRDGKEFDFQGDEIDHSVYQNAREFRDKHRKK